MKPQRVITALSLLLSIALAGTAYGQQSKDTLCLPTENVRGLLIAAKQGEVLKEQVTILDARIVNLQALVAATESRDSVAVAGLNANIKSLLEEKALYQDQIKGYEKLLKRERMKRRVTGLAGILTTAAAFYIGTR